MDLEGTEVCDWLTSKGITCVLLKDRVPDEELYPKSAPDPRSGPYPKSPIALEDAQRTVGLVRFHAAEWHIDPHKIGVLGFSAGGHLVAAMSARFEHRLYRGCRCGRQRKLPPGFCGGYLSGASVPRSIGEIIKLLAQEVWVRFSGNKSVRLPYSSLKAYLDS